MLSLVSLVSCTSSQYAIQFDSNPQGAAIVCDGSMKGYTPEMLYLTKKSLKGQKMLNLSGCKANWASGAQNYYGIVDLMEFPEGVRVNAPRPDAPNLSKDMDFALQVQQMKYKQAAEASEAQAKSLERLNKTLKDTADNIRKNTPTSTFTNCYNTLGGVNCSSTSY